MSKQSLAAALAEKRKPVRAIYISSYQPRKCGLATFTKDLTTALNNINPEAPAEIIAMNDEHENYDYPWEVKLRINEHERTDYELAAQYINQSSADLVCLQHEFGIFGGLEPAAAAEAHPRFYLLDLLEHINKPIVTTLHTIMPEPDADQRYIMQRLIDRSAAVVAMTENARQLLVNVYHCSPEKAIVIYHGVPDFTFNDIARHKRRLRVTANPMIISAGLIGPGKGIEHTIQAMPRIIEGAPGAKLYIVGQTHPVVLRTEGEAYRESLQALVRQLGLRQHVTFINRYLDDDELQRYFQAADFFISAYPNLDQSGSGMLAWALGAGKACVSTPYNYATEVLADGAGVFIEPRSADDIARAVVTTFQNKDFMYELRKKAYARGRKFTWPHVGFSYLSLFKLILSHSLHPATTPITREVAAR